MINTLYTHHKKGKKYCILHLCQFQFEDIWYEGVAYKEVESGEIYVRSEESFNNSFKVVEE